MYGSSTLCTQATLGAHSPAVLHCVHWLHLEPTHQILGPGADVVVGGFPVVTKVYLSSHVLVVGFQVQRVADTCQ
jgi:hypothetical protein